jgi:hypothetical protein
MTSPARNPRAAARRHPPAVQGREAPHVILYEDVSRKRVKRLVGAVRDMGAVGRALRALDKVRKTKG